MFNFYLKILAVVFLVWIAQILFLPQAARSGLNGWDDWGSVFSYDAYRANDLRNFSDIARITGTPYIWTEVYNIGLLKDVFGLHPQTFKLLQLLFKSLAALSAGYLVLKLTKDKLFSYLTVFFFVIFPSTAGPLDHIIFAGAYLTIVFMCFFVLFYIQSLKEPNKILLSFFFFFLALLVCPSRAYLIVPVPLLIEVVRLTKSFKPFTALKRLFIFYFPLLFLQIILVLNGYHRPASFMPHLEMIARFKQVTSGNLYTLSLPFQAISTLFMDPLFLQEILAKGEYLLPFINNDLSGFIVTNTLLFVLSLCLGLVVKGKKFAPFILKVICLTVLFEAIFYLLGRGSVHQGLITYINYSVGNTYSQTLNPSVFQASLGGFYLAFGLFLSWEWWSHQKDNQILRVIVFAWLWSVFSEVFLYLTNHWYTMIYQSFDRYIIVCSLGAVIFTAGIFSLCIKSIAKMKSLNLKIVSSFLVSAFILLIVWKNYKLLDRFYYNWNEDQGESTYWQDIMYQRFLTKFGKENLTKSVLLYIDFNNGEPAFNQGSFVYPARYRLFYGDNGKLIRGNCKAVISDINILKNTYVTVNGEKGFLADSFCVNPVISYEMKTTFYPLSNFYAYKIKNKEFIDIKKEILPQLVQTH